MIPFDEDFSKWAQTHSEKDDDHDKGMLKFRSLDNKENMIRSEDNIFNQERLGFRSLKSIKRSRFIRSRKLDTFDKENVRKSFSNHANGFRKLDEMLIRYLTSKATIRNKKSTFMKFLDNNKYKNKESEVDDKSLMRVKRSDVQVAPGKIQTFLGGNLVLNHIVLYILQ